MDTLGYSCPKWEAVHDYILAIRRRLTEPDRKAFLHFLDMVEDEAEQHADDCLWNDIMPIVVKALEPEPVDLIVTKRTAEDAEAHYYTTRIYAEQTGSTDPGDGPVDPRGSLKNSRHRRIPRPPIN